MPPYRDDARARLISLFIIALGLAVINRWCG